MSSFHLDLGQLWQCPLSWCTQWKGTPQDCVNHIRKKHYVNDSVKAANLRHCFPPWTVTRESWHTALKTKVSGISTDAARSESVLPMRPFMNDLQYFTIWDCADAKWAAKRNRTSRTGFLTSSDSPVSLPHSIRHRMSDDESPTCKAPQAVFPVMPGVSAHKATSTVVSAGKSTGPIGVKAVFGSLWLAAVEFACIVATATFR